MSVLVILEMDGDPDTLLAATADLEGRRPTTAVTARVIAPTDGGVVMCTVWESAAARDAYQSEPEHQEALEASGLRAAITGMRSRVFENAELSRP
jgi:heme-degrading monooxygenase HmoA